MRPQRNIFRLTFVLFVAFVTVVTFDGGHPASAAQGDTTRVSVGSDGIESLGGGISEGSPAMSDDGRYVAFDSPATDLVDGDTNGVRDVFVHDRQTGTTTRVSVDDDGNEGNGESINPAISSDGRLVVFDSMATNLVDGDTHGLRDVFAHDLQAGITTIISVHSDGTQGTEDSGNPAISGGGRYVTFDSAAPELVDGDNNNSNDVFLHDLQTNATTLVSVDGTGVQGNGPSEWSTISHHGRYIAFHSSATNLIMGDTNSSHDVFVHDVVDSTTIRISIDSTGMEGDHDSTNPSISSDGQSTSFDSSATNLVDGDNNAARDVFVHERRGGTTTRVSGDSNGTEGNGDSAYSALSSDGRVTTFQSEATNLTAGDTNGVSDVFVNDGQTEATTRVSVDSNGLEAGGESRLPTISADANFVAFDSAADNLVDGDTNASSDVFVHQYGVGSTTEPPLTTTTTEPSSTEPPSTTTTTQPAPATTVDWFIDDANSVFQNDINAIATAGITLGCNPPLNDRFCPNADLTRGQMASFLTRALDLLPLSDGNRFNDDDNTVYQADIEAIAAAGITIGCNPPVNDRFCPNADLTRGQMASFLTRAFNLPASDVDWFTDDDGSIIEADVNAVAAVGIVRGCNPPVNDRFCPNINLTRGQMAAVLARATNP